MSDEIVTAMSTIRILELSFYLHSFSYCKHMCISRENRGYGLYPRHLLSDVYLFPSEQLFYFFYYYLRENNLLPKIMQ